MKIGLTFWSYSLVKIQIKFMSVTLANLPRVIKQLIVGKSAECNDANVGATDR